MTEQSPFMRQGQFDIRKFVPPANESHTIDLGPIEIVVFYKGKFVTLNNDIIQLLRKAREFNPYVAITPTF